MARRSASAARAGLSHSSPWTNLTCLLVTLSAAGAAAVLANSALLLRRGAGAIVQECAHRDADPASPVQLSFLSRSTPLTCHFLRLRLRLPFGGHDGGEAGDDNQECFARAVLFSTLVLSSHYLVSCLLLLFGGVLAGVHPLFVPWLVAHAALVVLLAGMAAMEVSVGVAGVTASLGFWWMSSLTVASALAWAAGMVAWTDAKAAAATKEEERNKFVYERL